MANSKGKKDGKTMASKEMKKVRGGLAASIDQRAVESLKPPAVPVAQAPGKP
jgi:hypothetical protein